MPSYRLTALALVVTMGVQAATQGEPFELLTGVDAGIWPAPGRPVDPDPWPDCCANTFYDGDRLAGSGPPGPSIQYIGTGTPLYAPNAFGSLSFMFRRGTFPSITGQFYPWQGIDFLGGPLLDLDGDLGNGVRSLVPVFGSDAVAIPDATSFIDLEPDPANGTVALLNIDVTGTNEGGFGQQPTIATTVNTIAGTQPDGQLTPAINPGIDTRSGTLTAFAGTSGTLIDVWGVDEFGFEFWQDTLLLESSTASTLGTFQFLGAMHGWLIKRDPDTRALPTLTGEGLGATSWPAVNTSGIGLVVNTTLPVPNDTTVIVSGFASVDDYTAPGNGGTVATDLGIYLDTVVLPIVDPLADWVIYLESAGFGTNNSGDPLYVDSVSYDVVLIAQSAPVVDGDFDGDGDADLRDVARLQACFGEEGQAVTAACLIFDFDRDTDVDDVDFAAFEAVFNGPQPAN